MVDQEITKGCGSTKVRFIKVSVVSTPVDLATC